LTSRECAKLICALLAAGAVRGMNSSVVRSGLRVWCVAVGKTMQPDSVYGDPAARVDMSELDRNVLLLVMALVGGLAGMSTRDALTDAVTWVVETDEVWVAPVQTDHHEQN
jgi:hypothetical protein